jgi:hypothetical protein
MIEWHRDISRDGWFGAVPGHNAAVIIWREVAHPHRITMINIWDGGGRWIGDTVEEAKRAAVAQLVLWRMEHGHQKKP